MDFDDLDEAEAEVQSPDSGPAASAPAAAAAAGSWEFFPPIPRNFRLPDYDKLPPAIVKLVLGESDLHLKARPRVRIRAFVFYGAGDKWYEWAELAAKAPDYSEIAVHEWPSHGDAETGRGEEPACSSLDELAEDAFKGVSAAMEQHTAGGRIPGAPFVLIGHSIGCLLVVALAQKLKARMNLEPAAVVMLDRGAPHFPLHSEYGQKYAQENPWDFMRDYNRTIYDVAKSKAKTSPAEGERILKMWVDDVRLGSDVRPIGFHRFDCDVLVLKAVQNFALETLKHSEDPSKREEHERRDRCMGSPPGLAVDFSHGQFEEWDAWVAPGKLRLVDMETDHMRIKSNPACLRLVWDLLKERMAAEPR